VCGDRRGARRRHDLALVRHAGRRRDRTTTRGAPLPTASCGSTSASPRSVCASRSSRSPACSCTRSPTGSGCATRRRIAHCGLALDVGHVPCTEAISAGDAIRRYAARCAPCTSTTRATACTSTCRSATGDPRLGGHRARAARDGFSASPSVELSRHSHAAPGGEREAIEALARRLRREREL
jgi:hypothetical protein